ALLSSSEGGALLSSSDGGALLSSSDGGALLSSSDGGVLLSSSEGGALLSSPPGCWPSSSPADVLPVGAGVAVSSSSLLPTFSITHWRQRARTSAVVATSLAPSSECWVTRPLPVV